MPHRAHAAHTRTHTHTHNDTADIRHDAQAAAVAPNVFHLEWPRAGDQWRQDEMAQQWDAIRDVRSQTYKVLEAARAHKYVQHVSCSCVCVVVFDCVCACVCGLVPPLHVRVPM